MESDTIQCGLIKKILEFPYEKLGIQKGGIYGDETFNKEGYLSDSNINALRERLIKYKIIGFEFGNFGDYDIMYDSRQCTPLMNRQYISQCYNLKGKNAYAVYIDETGNCYGNYQLTNIIPISCSKGRSIAWADELFLIPFVTWTRDIPRPYLNQDYETHHWTELTGLIPNDKEIQKENDFSERINSVIRCKKIGEFSTKSMYRTECTGNPIRHVFTFKNITLAQVEECENIEAEEDKIKEEIRLIDLTIEKELKRKFNAKNEKLTQILELQKFIFLMKNKEYINSSILLNESNTRPPPEYESYFKYLCSVYGNIYKNLYSMISYVINSVIEKIDLSEIRFTEHESEKFLLMYRKHKYIESFNELEYTFYKNEYLSLKDIMKPIILLAICNVRSIVKYTIDMIEYRNTLEDNLDDIIILLEVLKNFMPDCVIPFNRIHEILTEKWITKENTDLWKNSIEKNIFQLSVTKRLITKSIYCNKFSELDDEKTIDSVEDCKINIEDGDISSEEYSSAKWRFVDGDDDDEEEEEEWYL
jgi:hypothetical protein